jgi:predicted TIM-barrel fold metal-dependent hydrolase
VKNGYKIVDGDLHLLEAPDTWTRYMDSNEAPKIMSSSAGFFALFQNRVFPAVDSEGRERFRAMRQRIDKEIAFAAAQDFDSASQLQAMDMEGIDVAVLFPTVALYVMGFEDIGVRLATDVCRAYNNWLYEYCKKDPLRLKGVALIPPHDVDASVREAQRAVKELGFVGALLHPSPHKGRLWHSPYYDPLWSALQELDVPVCFHDAVGQIIDTPAAKFGKNRLMAHTATHPIGMMNASLSVIAGGVLEVFPRLRVAFLEAYAGWLPYWLERMDHEYDMLGKWDAPTLTMKPSRYFVRQCFASADESSILQFVVDRLGNDSFLWSCDYPHWDSEFPEASQEFLERPLDEATKRKILWDNPHRLYTKLA